MASTTAAETRRRLQAYGATAAVLIALALLLTRAEWRTTPAMHAVHETAASLLALLVGCLALVRHYSRRESLFLLIGVAFLGTGALDAYHAIVSFIAPPEDTAGAAIFVPWSWTASRTFLAVFMLRLSLLPRVQFGRRGGSAREPIVFAVGMLLVATSLFALALVPLPWPYRDAASLARPMELVPAVLLLAALALQLRTRAWRRNVFEHWLVLSLICGFAGQTLFMAWSGELFDPWFDLAHLLKTLSYACVLVGLLVSVFFAYRRLDENRRGLASANAALQREIEVREAAERDLRIRTAYLEQLIDIAPEAIAVVDRNDRVLRVNAEFTAVFGYGPGEVFGRTIGELIVPASAGREAAAVGRAVANGLTVSYEAVRRHKDGSAVDVSILATPIRDAHGVIAVYGIYRDIGDRKRAELTRRADADRLEAIVAAAPVALIALDAAGSVRTWNDAAERLFGIGARRAVGRPLPRLSEDSDALACLDRALEGIVVDDIAFTTVTGADVRLSALPLADGSGGTLLVATAVARRAADDRARVQVERTTVDLGAGESHARFEWRPALGRRPADRGAGEPERGGR